MPETNFEKRQHPGTSTGVFRRPDNLADSLAANPSLALIVCSSPINRVVVSRIAEQAGMKVICETPQGAVETLASRRPGLIIFDCGVDHQEHHPIAAAIVDHRRAAGSGLPLLIVLSTKGLSADSALGNIADAILAKPITPDALQPKIKQLVEDARG